MSADSDLLTRAAHRLRKVACDATPGPWSAIGNSVRDGTTNDEDTLALTYSDSRRHRDAQYIARMHPGVALALAGWLEVLTADLDGAS